MTKLTRPELLDKVIAAVKASRGKCILLSRAHPYHLRVFRDDNSVQDVWVFIWNCTHGGGHRADDEYRIQVTGVELQRFPNGTTLLLGWHDGYGVFVGYDLRLHATQRSASPSLQIKESALISAHDGILSPYQKSNKEIAVAFQPDFFMDYAVNVERIHSMAGNKGEVEALATIGEHPQNLAKEVKGDAAPTKREVVLREIRQRVRLASFARRVLSAYDQRCAMCHVQLDLIDAAHIIPVAHEHSTDDTTNGVALCALHHRAYDNSLISFAENYQIEVSARALQQLQAVNRDAGLKDFRKGLLPRLNVPHDDRLRPKKEFIVISRKIRNWQA